MRNPFEKTPFLLLLLPLVLGIVLEYYLKIHMWSILLLLLGGLVMLLSYLLPSSKEYSLRWVFGLGMSLFFFAVGMETTNYSQTKTNFDFDRKQYTYSAIVEEKLEKKEKHTNYKIYLQGEDKRFIAYIENADLELGSEFIFVSKLSPFENRKRPNAFDYKQYMENKGFSGWTYISENAYKDIGYKYNLSILALVAREKILSIYEQTGLSADELAILSALTLGYRDNLDEETIESFRKTGTVHVLSVSGLHVGLIYSLITFMLIPFKRVRYARYLLPSIVLVLLWVYAFITGLSPSVVRAAGMLSVFCIANLLNQKTYSLHGLVITAFFILVIRPLWIFDIGFQLSFSAVFCILYFHSYLSDLFRIKNLFLRRTWQLSTISIAAQLGTFPLCLYYFGSFPSYFFISNLLIVPLISVVIYAGLLLVLLKAITVFLFSVLTISSLVLKFSKFSLFLLNRIISFFENLTFASIEGVYITIFELIFISVFVVCVMVFCKTREDWSLRLGSVSFLGLAIASIF